MTFGEKLKIARTEAGLKQAELAKQLNTTGNTISNWENNVSKPDLDTLSYICGILHVNASYFLQPQLPEDEVSIKELKIIKKYRDLDDHGREMVDFTLLKEWERSTAPKAQEEHIEHTAALSSLSKEKQIYSQLEPADLEALTIDKTISKSKNA